MSNPTHDSDQTAVEMLQQSATSIFDTAGEDVLIVTQRWKHNDRAAVVARLRTLPSARIEEDALSLSVHFSEREGTASDHGDDAMAMLDRLGHTVGFASLTAHGLELTTNSVGRAERISADVERVCGGLLERGPRSTRTLDELSES